MEKIHVVYLMGSACVVYYELLNQTRPLLGLSTDTIDEIEPSTQGKTRPGYYSRHDKIILLHDNARPHVAAPVKTYLETLK